MPGTIFDEAMPFSPLKIISIGNRNELGMSAGCLFTPNEETKEAIAEVDEMVRTGPGEHFTGSAAGFFTATVAV